MTSVNCHGGTGEGDWIGNRVTFDKSSVDTVLEDLCLTGWSQYVLRVTGPGSEFLLLTDLGVRDGE